MKTSSKVYSYTAIENFINDTLIPHGYEIIQVPGCLVDNYICYAPDEKHYNFLFLEKPLNAWSSGLFEHKFSKIRKSEQEIIDRLMAIYEEQSA